MSQDPKAVVLVAGGHGVGKGTLCERLADRTGAAHLIASELIRSAKRLAKTKYAPDIEDNQKLLIDEFHRSSRSHTKILLDGHFCLLNQSGGLHLLPIEMFRSLEIDRIILVRCDPLVAYERLSARDGSNNVLDQEQIRSLQEAETIQAEKCATELSMPIISVDTTRPFEIDRVVEFVDWREPE